MRRGLGAGWTLRDWNSVGGKKMVVTMTSEAKKGHAARSRVEEVKESK